MDGSQFSSPGHFLSSLFCRSEGFLRCRIVFRDSWDVRKSTAVRRGASSKMRLGGFGGVRTSESFIEVREWISSKHLSCGMWCDL